MASTCNCAETICVLWLSRDKFSAAVEEGRVEDVVAFLQRGNAEALVSQPSPKYRHSPWHVASHKGHLEVLRAMADALLKGSDSSVLITASLHRKFFSGAQQHSESTREALLQEALMHGIKGGYSPLMLAARAGHKDVVAYLMDVGADCWQTDNHGMAAIHHAARHNNFLVVQELVLRAPPPSSIACRLVKPTTKYINCPDGTGWTALHFAAVGRHQETVATLLSYNANLIARTLKPHPSHSNLPIGCTALHIAAVHGNLPMIVQLLRAHFEGLASLLPNHLDSTEQRRRQRAHPDPRLVISRTGQLPYHLARHSNRTDVLEWLDPSVPLMFLLSATDEGTSRGSRSEGSGQEQGAGVIGVPRLTLLVAKALHAALLIDLGKVEGEQLEKAKAAAMERQLRVEAAEAAAKERGIWMARRAAERAVASQENPRERSSMRAGDGRQRRASSNHKRSTSVSSTPQRLMDAVRSSISRFAHLRPASPTTNDAHLTYSLEMPGDPDNTPFARFAANGRSSSGAMPPPESHHQYSVIQILTNASTSAQSQALQISLPDSDSLRTHDASERHLAGAHNAETTGSRVLLVTAADQDPLSHARSAPRDSSCDAAAHQLLDAPANNEAARPRRWTSRLTPDTSVPGITAAGGMSLPRMPSPCQGTSSGLSASFQGQRSSDEQSPSPTEAGCTSSLLNSQLPGAGLLSVTPVSDIEHLDSSHSLLNTQLPVPGTLRSVSISPEPESVHRRRAALPGIAREGIISSATPSSLQTREDRTTSRPSCSRSGEGTSAGADGNQFCHTGFSASDGEGHAADGQQHRDIAPGSLHSIPVLHSTLDSVPPQALERNQDLDPSNRRSAAQSLFDSIKQPFRRISSQVQPLPNGASAGSRDSLSRNGGRSASNLADDLSRPLGGGRCAYDSSRSKDLSRRGDDSMEAEDVTMSKSMATCIDEGLDDANEDSAEEDVCPVCLDEVPNVQLSTCKHKLCLGCAKDLCKRHCLTPALCPYCRSIISGFSLEAA